MAVSYRELHEDAYTAAKLVLEDEITNNVELSSRWKIFFTPYRPDPSSALGAFHYCFAHPVKDGGKWDSSRFPFRASFYVYAKTISVEAILEEMQEALDVILLLIRESERIGREHGIAEGVPTLLDYDENMKPKVLIDRQLLSLQLRNRRRTEEAREVCA